jgi:hypothetical protein
LVGEIVDYVTGIPLNPADRYAYLECGLMPGSAIVLTPICEEEDLGDNEDIETVVDTSTCEATSWTVTVTGGSAADGVHDLPFVSLGPGGGFWHYGGWELGPDAPILVDVVRIADSGTDTRYVVVVSVWDIAGHYDNYWAQWTDGTNCCNDAPHTLDLLDSTGADSGFDATVEAVCPT